MNINSPFFIVFFLGINMIFVYTVAGGYSFDDKGTFFEHILNFYRNSLEHLTMFGKVLWTLLFWASSVMSILAYGGIEFIEFILVKGKST